MKNAVRLLWCALSGFSWLILAVAGSLGFSGIAAANVEKLAEREVLEARVLEVRKLLYDAESETPSNGASRKYAQWYNWPNWGNWNNWPNWNNWGNWFNR